jgi:transcriptional regulator GlxA family with amidase domain
VSGARAAVADFLLSCFCAVAPSIAERVKVLAVRDNDMPERGTCEIGIVLYPGVQMAAVHGLTDLFSVAAKLALNQRRGRPRLRVMHWQPAHTRDAELSCVYDSAPGGKPRPRILVIPPTMVNLPDPDVPPGVVSWIRDRHSDGATLVSVCSGAFILAKTGLADGRAVATHQICQETLAKRFPKITVSTNRRIIDHGDIVTAGGFLAWVDIGLYLVDRILGPAVKAETARFVLSDPACSDTPYFVGFPPPQTHHDNAVLKAQEWVHMRDGRGVSLASMAAIAGLQRRTFLRRFAKATGMTPLEYCRAVRIARARELLISGDTPQKAIAQSLGYKDVASFARVFRKATGSTPGGYRNQFGVPPRESISEPNSSKKRPKPRLGERILAAE